MIGTRCRTAAGFRCVNRVVLVLVLVIAPQGAAADERGVTNGRARWDGLHQASQATLSAVSAQVADSQPRDLEAPVWIPAPGTLNLLHPPVIVVGFTGGLEGRDSRVSGVVRMRDAVRRTMDGTPHVVALTYNNFRWREAGRDVLELAQLWMDCREAQEPSPPSASVAAVLPQPIVVVYGHSWGGGSIGKFARLLQKEGLDVSLAVYIDAFTLRNPRVPENVRYAVNFYQRTGLLRGLPLRGKRHLIPESPDATVVLGSYRLSPQTDHFGWNWNLIQPLLYRHHHRIGHDVRLRQYLLEIVGVHLALVS